MLLGLSKIIDSPGASVTFSTTVDLSDLCYGVSYPVSEPVAAEGTVRNTAGVLVMTGEISTCIHGTVSRKSSMSMRLYFLHSVHVWVVEQNGGTAGIGSRDWLPWDKLSQGAGI